MGKHLGVQCWLAGLGRAWVEAVMRKAEDVAWSRVSWGAEEISHPLLERHPVTPQCCSLELN